MVHRCCISSCGMSVRVAEAKGLSYHAFPIKEPMREKWMTSVLPHLDKPESFKLVQGYTRVCSRHFRLKDYSLDSKKRARLSSTAIPSVFPKKSTSLISNSTSNAKGKVPVSKVKSPPPPPLNEVPPSSTPTQLSPPPTSDASNSLSSQLGSHSITEPSQELILTAQEPAKSEEIRESEPMNESLSHNNNSSSTSENFVGKKRVRRKWNRTAYARSPAKGLKKRIESAVVDQVENALAGMDLKSLLSSAPGSTLLNELGNKWESPNKVRREDGGGGGGIGTTISTTDDEEEGNPKGNKVQLLSSIEQELLQSIQAVTLNCGDGGEGDGLHLGEGSAQFIPQFIQSSQPDSPTFLDPQSLIDPLQLGQMNTTCTRLSTPSNSDIEMLANNFNSSLLTSISRQPPPPPPPHSTSIILNFGNLGKSTPTPFTFLPPPTPSNKDGNKKQRGEKGDEDKCKGKELSKKKSGDGDGGSPGLNSDRKKLGSGISKRPKKEKSVGRFSVERFRHLDKDIEYYTGFGSYASFESFFHSINTHVQKLRVTDMMCGVTDLIQLVKSQENLNLVGSGGVEGGPSEDGSDNSSSTTATSLIRSPATSVEPSAAEEIKPPLKTKRMKQGRLLSCMDELFMTIIRLKRRLPEKVLGHMFCISQPTVSRVIRAWVMLLSKIIELDTLSMGLPSSRSNSLDRISIRGGGGTTSTSSSPSPKPTRRKSSSKGGGSPSGIPDSFRQLFQTDFAKSIINVGGSGSRKSSLSSSSASATSSPKRQRRKTTPSLMVESPPSSSSSSYSNITINNNSPLVGTALSSSFLLSDSSTSNANDTEEPLTLANNEIYIGSEIFTIEDFL